MKDLVIYFRKAITPKEEIEAAREAGFEVSFSMIHKDKKVLARYSVLPYYKDLESDLLLQGSHLFNSYHQHQYISSFDYYYDIEPLTFKTWFRLEDLPKDGPFIVKGVTNSKKSEWKEKMYAEDKKRAIEVSVLLQKDGLIGHQDIIVRRYEKLQQLEEGINGLPFSNEWRFFFYKGKLIDYGFYWVQSETKGSIDQAGIDFAQRAADIIKESIDFFVIDVAKKETGEWVVVECNDGQMSGLSDIDAKSFYQKIFTILKEENN